jgi:WD40-like Beta Propeller Repeat
MPAQQRLGPYQEGAPVAPRQHSAQRRKKQPVVWLEARLTDLPSKNRQLVPEDENLQLLRPLTPTKKHDKLEQAVEDEVDDRHKQRRPPTDGMADVSGASAGHVPHPIEYLHPTRSIWLKTGGYAVDRPAWSPDGKSITFGANLRHDVLDVALSVRVVAMHGGPVHTVVADGYEPAWSPDGRWLAYEIYSNFQGPTQIRIARSSGPDDRLVHNLPEGNAIPSWSPDGKRIAVFWYPPGDDGDYVVIYLVRPDGTGFERIYGPAQ